MPTMPAPTVAVMRFAAHPSRVDLCSGATATTASPAAGTAAEGGTARTEQERLGRRNGDFDRDEGAPP